MDLNTLIESAPTAALALVALYLFFTGKIHSDPEFQALKTELDEAKAETRELRAALNEERGTVNETAQAATVTNQLIGALASIASQRQQEPAGPQTTGRQPQNRGLTAEDVDL